MIVARLVVEVGSGRGLAHELDRLGAVLAPRLRYAVARPAGYRWVAALRVLVVAAVGQVVIRWLCAAVLQVLAIDERCLDSLVGQSCSGLFVVRVVVVQVVVIVEYRCGTAAVLRGGLAV